MSASNSHSVTPRPLSSQIDLHALHQQLEPITFADIGPDGKNQERMDIYVQCESSTDRRQRGL